MKGSRFASSIIGVAGALALLGCVQPVLAGRLVDVSIVNRSTGERLTPWRHGGRMYVAGTPGERYAVELRNRQSERVLTVLSVDGVNVLTGQTASTLQSGYVIDAGQTNAVSGWRKSMDEVAQFVFTALPDSYAARTGRPGNVGVIGVAAYRERVAPSQPIAMAPAAEPWRAESRQRSADEAAAGGLHGEVAAGSAKSLGSSGNDSVAIGALADRRTEAEAASRRLGTGHGAREHAPTRHTEFARGSDTPDEIVTIYYDSRANLIARGIIPPPRFSEPSPFPGNAGFVPDPRG